MIHLRSLLAPKHTSLAQYSVTITADGASSPNPTKGSTSRDVGVYKIIGDLAWISYEYYHSASGAAGSGTYLFSLPPGISIDTTRIANTITPVGVGRAVSDGNAVPTWVYATAQLNNVYMARANYVAETFTNIGSGQYNIAASSVTYAFTCVIPILGYKSFLRR